MTWESGALVAVVVGVLALWIAILHGDVKRARLLGEREGYLRGYRQGRDGGAPEDW